VLPIVVASERTDANTSGTVSLVVPPGWEATPPERLYTLAPGAHLAFEAAVRPAADAAPGRYFVAARITDDSGQQHEDVVTIDHRAPVDGAAQGESPIDRSAALAWAIERALTIAGAGPAPGEPGHPRAQHDRGGELRATLADDEVAVEPGRRATLRVSLANLAASEIRGEAQVISPFGTWSTIRPWTQGFVVGAGDEVDVAFDVAPPIDAAPGTTWALVKVMYFGRILYTESVPIRVLAPVAAPVRQAAPPPSAPAPSP